MAISQWLPRAVFVALMLMSLPLLADEPSKTAAHVGRSVPEFSLPDFRGKMTAWAEVARERKFVVVTFLGTECPLAKHYGRRLAELAREFEKRGVAFVGVNSNSQDSITELAAYARLHDIHFPLLKDAGNRIADQWQATRTPEVFVVDAQRVVRYHGRVDDQYGVGYARDEAKRADLRMALNELLAGKPVPQAETPVIGCLIGRAKAPEEKSPVTYSKQIARLLNQRCVECHRPGEIGPFSLTNYEDASAWADMIAEVVADGRMPPWHADPKHGRFAESRHLSAEEKRLIREWVAAGAPRGNVAELPETPKFGVTGWMLPREPDAVFAMSTTPFKVPGQGTVKYQFFATDTNFTEDKWVTAMEVLPGNRAVVHHALVFARAPGERGGLDESAEHGFLAAYVPGLRAAPFPAGMAKRIPAGSKLLFQLHYTPVGTEQTDVTKVAFCFTDPKTIVKEVRTMSVVGRPLRIPPGADNHRIEAQSKTAPVSVELLAMMPHMHLRGKAFSYEAVFTDGRRETLLDIPHYDFNWQTAYRLSEPRQLPAGAYVRCVARFDNSENNLNNPDPTRTVGWGPQTWDEMMIGYFDIAVSRELTDDIWGPVKKNSSTPRFNGDRLFTQLDKNNDGKISRDEVPERTRPVFDRLDTDKSGHLSKSEFAKLQELMPNLRGNN